MEIEKKEGFDRKILEKVEMGEMSVEGNVQMGKKKEMDEKGKDQVEDIEEGIMDEVVNI